MLALMQGESPDRRRRYDERMKERGHVKRTYWLPEELADDLRDILRMSVDDAQPLRAVAVRAMIGVAAKVARGEGDLE